jgi:ferredoxin--NADP+ reductase
MVRQELIEALLGRFKAGDASLFVHVSHDSSSTGPSLRYRSYRFVGIQSAHKGVETDRSDLTNGSTRMDATNPYDLVIIGGSAGGLSVAISSARSGLGAIRVVEASHAVSFPELVGDNELDIGFGESVSSIEADDGGLRITTNKHVYSAHACLVAARADATDWSPPIPSATSDRIHVDDCPPEHDDHDVLVVGFTDHAVELTATVAATGSRVVLAAGGMDPTLLSPAGESLLRRLERERRATILYRSIPDQVGLIDGYPMAFFNDRRTPDLQFDHVIFSSPRAPLSASDVGATDDAMATGLLWFLGEPDETDIVTTAPGWRIGEAIAEACFPDLELPERPSPTQRRRQHTGVIDELRHDHYNATITHFEPTHSDLWVLRVSPDHGTTAYVPGQYASLGLGYWEERIDDAEDPAIDDRWDKLIRRSYSISSRMFDPHGYLTNDSGDEGLEFYVVLVKPTPDNVPGLTPRLALKRPGDRIYLGPKVAGRYTLGSVIDPETTVVLLSTGTGEAPHNAMVVNLLQKGHYGPIVSAVSVREWADLGYMDHHRTLESRYPNYHYLPIPTREAAVPKRYIQDLLRDGDIEELVGELNPASTHVYLCGNPSMIGLPEEVDGAQQFPATEGVCGILTKRGFKLDERKSPGNIHYEEYW